ncbi:hypothetical protein BGZ65_010471 [Modicella reniformis]|uniref:Uncharacterized protein n=1 Tax=Modicella reniformis TaxID=1440133 RepID=A0A9P6J6Q3_9FUNG|nr:hypothetical protein BGZ65_010471 [Modicella reniformis]
MAALADTLATTEQLQQLSQQGHDKRASQRGKRLFAGPSLSLASLHSSISQMSLSQERKSAQSATISAKSSPASYSQPPVGVGQKNNNSRDSKPALPQLQIPFKNSKDKNNGGYFGGIVDGYSHSDDDPTSPSTASPTSPFTTHDWVDFRTAQPPTPPVNISKPPGHLSNQMPRRVTPLRSSSSLFESTLSAENSSPILAASAKFSAFVQSKSDKDSQESFSLTGSSAPSSVSSSISSGHSSPSSSLAPSPTMRAYSKKPVPEPPSAPSSQLFDSAPKELQDTNSEPPVKDSARHLPQTQHRNNSNSHLPLQPNAFPSVVMEAMRRNRASSVAGTSTSSIAINPYAGNPSMRERSNSTQSYHSNLSLASKDRYSIQQHYPGREDQFHSYLHQQQRQHLFDPHQRHSGMRPRSYLTPRPSVEQAPSPIASQGLSPSEMLFRRFDDQSRILSQSPLSTSPESTGSGGMKSAMVRNHPLGRARAKNVNDQRKVIFGDTITIVTVERTETPPPPPADKKKKKKKKGVFGMGSSKAGPHPDPEYDSDYYNGPYTAEPAEVVVSQAPWIGNPNYDEEKQNSKFYYDDDYEEEGEAYSHGIPEDGGEYEGEYEGEDEDEYEHEVSGSPSKKKGGIFKFKRAVNRLLRN